MDFNNMIFFMIATLTLNFTPGPDMMYVITRSISEGKKAGIASAFGIAGGTVCHTLAVAFGLSGLLLAVPTAYDIIRYIGGAYLVYIGFRMLLSKKSFEEAHTYRKGNLRSVFYQGMFTNLFNPKVALFFLAFLPQFIDTNSPSVTLQIILLGILFNVSGTIVNVIVAIATSRMGNIIKSKLNNSNVFKYAASGIFIGLGIRLALMERK